MLSYQPLTNSDISNSIDLTQDCCCFGNQDPYTPSVKNINPPILKMSVRESEQQSQNLMASRFHHNFQKNLYFFKRNRNKTMNQSTMKSCLKP